MPSDWAQQTPAMRTPKGIILSGIFTHGNKNIAVINNKSVGKGDFIQGYEVIKISKNEVYLKNLRGIVVVPLNAKVLTPVVTKKRSSKGTVVK